MRERTPLVPSAVRDAFGLQGSAARLAGGEGLSVRVGDVVLKRVHDADEAEWVQQVQSRIVEDGFRIARPVPTIAGRWTHGGWSAAEYVAGLRSATPRWPEVVDVGLRFSDAATAAAAPTGALARRRHRWAVADRFAWGETHLDLAGEVADVHVQLAGLLGDGAASPEGRRVVHGDLAVDGPASSGGRRVVCGALAVDGAASSGGRRVVHGDLAGNVHVDRNGVPVVLDFSPYVRPRAWAAATVVADAVLWHDADLSLATSFAATAPGRDLLGRALIFRLAAEPPAPAARRIRPYRRVLAALA